VIHGGGKTKGISMDRFIRAVYFIVFMLLLVPIHEIIHMADIIINKGKIDEFCLLGAKNVEEGLALGWVYAYSNTSLKEHIVNILSVIITSFIAFILVWILQLHIEARVEQLESRIRLLECSIIKKICVDMTNEKK
jgi:hypothetical protein